MPSRAVPVRLVPSRLVLVLVTVLLSVVAVTRPALALDDGSRTLQARVGSVEGFGSSTTGGDGGRTYWVTTLADSGAGSLRAGAESDEATWVRFSVSGTITLSSPIRVGDNTTIDGRGQDVSIAVSGHTTGMEISARNVIVHGLEWVGGAQARQSDSSGEPTADAININGGSRIWIDHNTMTGWGDKLVGIPDGSDVTVSYNRFHDMGPGHAILIGTKATASRQADARITVHHNVFENIPDRSPRVGDGATAHVYNNYVVGWSYYGMKAIRGAQMLAENNVLGNGANDKAIMATEGSEEPGRVRASGNLVQPGQLVEQNSSGSVFTPPYSYRLETATSDLRDRLLASAGADGADVPGDPGTPAPTPTPTPTPTPEPEHVDRVAGADRVATAVALSHTTFRSADTVVVASSSTPVDALAGSPLATALHAPLLLVPQATLPAVVRTEIRRLGADRVVVLGGPRAVSGAVVQSLRAEADRVDRLAGADRFTTAAAIARAAVDAWGEDAPNVLVASGSDRTGGWADALGAAQLAARTHSPLLLVDATSAPAATRDAIRQLDASRVIVLGGTRTVPLDVARAAAGSVPWERIAGRDRYATAALIADRAAAAGVGTSRAIAASGADWPDALAAGPAARRWGASLVLVPPSRLASSNPVAGWLADHDTDEVRVAGGRRAVADRVLVDIDTIVGR